VECFALCWVVLCNVDWFTHCLATGLIQGCLVLPAAGRLLLQGAAADAGTAAGLHDTAAAAAVAVLGAAAAAEPSCA
jgi:hypothetical protein